MKTRRVVSNKNLPMRLPILGTMVWCLLLDKFSAPGWVWGVFGTLLVVVWITAIIDTLNREQVEVIKGD